MIKFTIGGKSGSKEHEGRADDCGPEPLAKNIKNASRLAMRLTHMARNFGVSLG